MSIQTGDTVTIRRGKNAGQSGKVTAVSRGKVVLEMPDGDLQVQAGTNVKAPDAPTINADDLATEINTAFEDATLEDTSSEDVLLALVARLERKLPGLAGQIPKSVTSA